MRSAKNLYLSLGSNVGDRRKNIERALLEIEEKEVHILTRSSVYETEPQDVTRQPWFLNMVVECETGLLPLQLLQRLQTIERELGRVRTESVRRGPRIIDIDILLFANIQMQTPALTIPHPRMFDRRFVLEPLLEIAPELRHPETRELLSRYLQSTLDQKLRPV